MSPSPLLPEPSTTGLGNDYQDTIALLQDEIARLEAELRLHTEARETSAWQGPSSEDRRFQADLEARLQGLSTDLAGREETIAFLLDHIAGLEANEAAARAEWEQLQSWADKIEDRVEAQGSDAEAVRRDLEAQRRAAEDLRRTLETERRAAISQKQIADGELARLREEIADLVTRAEASAAAHQARLQQQQVRDAEESEAEEDDEEEGVETEAVLRVLEEENRRLRQTCYELTRASAAATEAEELRRKYDQVRARLDQAEQELRQARDEHARLVHEHQAEVASLMARKAREALAATTPAASVPEAADAYVPQPEIEHRPSILDNAPYAQREASIDERIRAFRIHLQDVHQREEAERARNSFSSKLSRLWGKSRPVR